jgi:hypothetical protein
MPTAQTTRAAPPAWPATVAATTSAVVAEPISIAFAAPAPVEELDPIPVSVAAVTAVEAATVPAASPAAAIDWRSVKRAEPLLQAYTAQTLGLGASPPRGLLRQSTPLGGGVAADSKAAAESGFIDWQAAKLGSSIYSDLQAKGVVSSHEGESFVQSNPYHTTLQVALLTP